MKEILVICKKCSSKVPASSLRMDRDEKMLMCRGCLRNKEIHREIEKEVFGKKAAKNEKMENKPPKEMHKCANCSYSFRINPETKIPKNCPYCNKDIDFSVL